jgi:hypothetical protein
MGRLRICARCIEFLKDEATALFTKASFNGRDDYVQLRT